MYSRFVDVMYVLCFLIIEDNKELLQPSDAGVTRFLQFQAFILIITRFELFNRYFIP